MSGVKNSYLKQRDDLEMKMLSTRSNRASSTIKAKKRKIVVLGKLGVGKTSLIRRYIDNIFPEKVLNQSEETFTKNIVYKKEEIKLVLLDTIGQNEFTPFLQNKYCIGVHGYILIYAINDNNSFEAIQHINNILLDAMGSKYVPRIIVGSKKDLETERDVSQERLNKFANQTKAPCIECSALYGNDDLDNIIYKLIKEINKETNDQYPYNIKNSMIHMNFIRNNHNLFNQLLIGFQIVLIIFGFIFLAFIIFLWIKIKISFDFKLFFNIISSVLNIINAVTGINAIKLSNYLKMKNFLFVLVLNIVMNIIIITTLFTGSSNLLQLIKNENNHIEYLIISILILILQISSMYICINLTPLYEEFQNSKSMNENLIFRV